MNLRCKNKPRLGKHLVWLMALLPAFAEAQEAIRMSLASAEAAEARRKAASTLSYSNLQLGPTLWSFGAGLGLSYESNIRLEGDATAKSDFIFRPQVDARMLWPVSERNTLNLSIGGGYSFYLENGSYDRLFITPGTELSFDVYVGPLWINLHDRFSIQEDTYQDPTVVGSADYSRMENTLGTTVTWDLSKIVLRLGYDHADYMSLGGGQSAFPDGSAEMFFTTAGYLLRPQATVGLEGGFSYVTYDLSQLNSLFEQAIQVSIGPFVEAQFSEYIKGRVGGGYTMFMPQSAGPGVSDITGYYLQGGVTHRLNQYVEYGIGGGRRITFTFYGGTIDLYNVSVGATWNVLEKIRLNTAFIYEAGSYLYGYNEEFDRLGPSLTVERRITEKLYGSFNFQYYWRESNLPGRNYTAAVVGLNLRYQF